MGRSMVRPCIRFTFCYPLLLKIVRKFLLVNLYVTFTPFVEPQKAWLNFDILIVYNRIV